MKEVNACGQSINENLARAAIVGTGKKLEIVAMHPLQLMMIANLFEKVAVPRVIPSKFLEEIEAVRKFEKEYEPSKFLGMDIVQDPSIQETSIEFRKKDGEIIARIVCLATPAG